MKMYKGALSCNVDQAQVGAMTAAGWSAAPTTAKAKKEVKKEEAQAELQRAAAIADKPDLVSADPEKETPAEDSEQVAATADEADEAVVEQTESAEEVSAETPAETPAPVRAPFRTKSGKKRPISR